MRNKDRWSKPPTFPDKEVDLDATNISCDRCGQDPAEIDWSIEPGKVLCICYECDYSSLREVKYKCVNFRGLLNQ